MLIGATMEKANIPAWKDRLAGNDFIRIFPDAAVSIGGSNVKMPPDWTDSRFAYCRDYKVAPFISSKGNGTDAFVAAIRDYLLQMPAWVTTLYYADWHEPEANYGAGSAAGAAKYKAEQVKVWNMVKGLPAAIRARVKFGPILTKQWTEAAGKGNNNYSIYDPGIGDFLAIDAYVLSSLGGQVVNASTLPAPAAFLQYIKAYKFSATDTRPRMFPEIGLIGYPSDTDGTQRAAWIRGVYAELLKWKVGAAGWTQPWSFAGMAWWNEIGAATGQVPLLGNRRDFTLNLRSNYLRRTGAGTDSDPYVWVSEPVLLPGNPAAPEKAWADIWRAEHPNNDGGGGGGSGDGVEPPVRPPYGGRGAYRIGATMSKADIPSYQSRMTGNQIFRVFPNADGLPPSWDDPRFVYAKASNAMLICSSNIDGDASKFAAMRTWIINMPAWVTTLILSDRHEPENNMTADKYKANYIAWWKEVILKLPAAIRARVKAGPILTRQWIEDPRKGNGNFSLYDPGLAYSDVYMIDAYQNSWAPGADATKVAPAYTNPVTFLSGFKAYKLSPADNRPRLLAELGAIGIPADPDGTQRAGWMTGIFKELDTWGSSTTGWTFWGVAWWNNVGTSGPSLTPIGTTRYMYLDKWQNGSGKLVQLPGKTPAPLAAYNQAVMVHGEHFSDPKDPYDGGNNGGGNNGGGNNGGGNDGGGGDGGNDGGDGGDNGGNNGGDGGPQGPVIPPTHQPPNTGGVPIDSAAAGRLLTASYTILVTDQNLTVLGDPLYDWTSLQATLRWKEPGSGQIVVPAYQYVREQLVPGCRIVIIRHVLGTSHILISGPMESYLRELSDDGDNSGVGQLTITFTEDLAWIAARLALPQPDKTPHDQTADFWTYSGNPENAMLTLVSTQAGPKARLERQVPRLVVAGFSGIQGTGTVALGNTTDVNPRERFETCTTVLRKICDEGVGSGYHADSLGFRTRQTQIDGLDVIAFEPIRSRDLVGDVMFSRTNGTLKYAAFELDAPTLTHPIVGGQYNVDDANAGADKLVDEFPTTDPDQLRWGRWEGYVPRPGTDTLAERLSAAKAELKEAGQSARLASSAADTLDQRFGIHYNVGDLVPVELGIGEHVIAPVQTVNLQAWPTAGEVVGTTIGDQGARYSSRWIRAQRLMDMRIGQLERRAVTK